LGTLEDQLKQWKKAAASRQPTPSSAPPQSKRAAKKKAPRPQTIRREEPPPPPKALPPKPPTDAELFAAAVEGVTPDAVLDKFAAAPAVVVKGERLTPSPPKDDATLFREFVGAVPPKTSPKR